MLASAAEPRTLYFERETAEEATRVALRIEGEKVTGSQAWVPKKGHGARGYLEGTLDDEGLVHVLHHYTIESSEQVEEAIFKLEGDTLLVGSGELVEEASFNFPDAPWVLF